MTTARVLMLLTGAAGAAGGALAFAPETGTQTRLLGVALGAAALACWWTTWRLRRPGRPTAVSAVLVVTAVLVLLRGYQALRLGTALPLAGLLPPALACWWLRVPTAKAWCGGDPGCVRRARAFGAVTVTVAGLLVAIGGIGVAAAWPCAFPAPPVPALGTADQDHGPAPAPSGRFRASDGTALAYYAFVPAHPVAALVFYHGSGARSTAGYLPFARVLRAAGIATYLVDMRGHGTSGGPRGDTPTPAQLAEDTATVVAAVHDRTPDTPEFLGGHSAGAGLVLNSIGHIRTPLAGYVFLAPDLGLHSGTERVADAGNFATVCRRPFVLHALSNGLLDGHAPAVGFAYTRAQIATGLVARYTVDMALAQDAGGDPRELDRLHAPLGIWIGGRDEVFDPARVARFARHSRLAATTVVPGADHLGVLTAAAPAVGAWLRARTTEPGQGEK